MHQQHIGLTKKRASALLDLRTVLQETSEDGNAPVPSERELAEQIGVSRGLVRSLLTDLEDARAIRRVSAYRRIFVNAGNARKLLRWCRLVPPFVCHSLGMEGIKNSIFRR